MKALRSFPVRASLPPRLSGLLTLAGNLRWTWDERSAEVFRWIDGERWEEAEHNPIRLLALVPPERLEALAGDPAFLAYLQTALDDLDRYVAQPRWFQGKEAPPCTVGYFSPEFGLTEAIPMYSGGLGVLAGDHLKAASDLGVPLVGVGVLYSLGYFRQYLNLDGWQQESYPGVDPHTLPLALVENGDGEPLTVHVDLAGAWTAVQVWRAQVGRIPLYLLDTDLEGNSPGERAVTDRLYGGEIEHRLRQEILLGIGGCAALEVMGIEPDVYHLNEGHAGFLALERIRRLVTRSGLTYAEAVEAARPGMVFTTHTPVPAGIDLFPYDLMEKYFSALAIECGVSFDELMAVGQADPTQPKAPFNMAVMGLRLSGKANAVSRLHGEVSRRMFHHLWPTVPEAETPITHITNGIHARTWTSSDMVEIYDRYLGPDWAESVDDSWERIADVADEEVWRARERAREELVTKTRRHLRRQLLERGAIPSEVEWADEVLDPRILTVGFARRFAQYKRAALLLRDPDRLRRLLSGPRPVQVVFAGKAHPHDEGGKELIRRIVHFASEPDVRTRVVFLENYDIGLARTLYQGVDVWLNTPRRGNEACGTSGMKAALNGALNLSILDGWWDELYDGQNGWAIGKREEYADAEYQDQVEASLLYDLLERQVAATFYERREGRVPRGWVARIKSSISSLGPTVRASRMVRDYVERLYLPSAAAAARMADDSFARARQLAKWKVVVTSQWPQVVVRRVETDGAPTGVVGAEVGVQVFVDLGGLWPTDVSVELAHGTVDREGQLSEPMVEPLAHAGADGQEHHFEGRFVCRSAGLYGFTVRVVPLHEDLTQPHETGLVAWP